MNNFLVAAAVDFSPLADSEAAFYLWPREAAAAAQSIGGRVTVAQCCCCPRSVRLVCDVSRLFWWRPRLPLADRLRPVIFIESDGLIGL